MRHFLRVLLVGAALAGGGALLSAQFAVPEIQFDSAPDPLKLPDNIYMGEAAGVATNSKGDVFVYTRTGNPTITLGTARAVSHGGSRLFQFDRSGKFVREIGQGAYGLLQAQQVRVDRQDNVWIVDQMSTQVIKFDPNGRVQMILSRKPEAMRVPAFRSTPRRRDFLSCKPAALRRPPAAGRGAAPQQAARGQAAVRCRGGRRRRELSIVPPTSPGMPPATSMLRTATATRRIAKYEPGGKYIKSWGSRGRGPGQFNIVHGIAIDAQGNVYAADEGNRRVQVFDSDGTFKRQFLNVGTPTAICITPGPRQSLYIAHTGDPDGMEDAAIYKVDLDGKLLGKFGRAGKLPKEFGIVNSIDCRNENELLVGELANWRVQKLTLKPQSR